MSGYDYPINESWSTTELMIVVDLFNAVEQAYEEGIPIYDLQARYQAFKKIVTSKGEERSLGREFEKLSGYSLYTTIKTMIEATQRNERSDFRIIIK